MRLERQGLVPEVTLPELFAWRSRTGSLWKGMLSGDGVVRSTFSGSVDANVLPRWATRDARTIKPREVIELPDEIAERAPVMANRVGGLLSQMFRFGINRAIVE